MTNKRYFDEPLITQFEAQVIEQTPQDKGFSHIVLDQTYFYPTGGGQSHDIGRINGQQVVDVRSENGTILHVVQGTIEADTVQAHINKDRRWRNMHAHTGQHILSAAFIHALEAETVAVKMNPHSPSTVDLDQGDLTAEQIAEVERMANQVIMENRAVKSYFLAPDDPKLGELRRAVKFDKVSGDVRIVEIEDWDMSACAGTHFPTTGMLGMMKILKTENYKRGSRVHFAVGYEALAQFQHYYQVATDVSNLLNAGTGDVPGLVQKLQDERQALSKQVAQQQEALSAFEKDQLLSNAQQLGDIRLVTAQFENHDSNALKTLANVIREESHTVAVFANQQDNNVGVVVSASEDSAVHAGNLLRALVADFNGRGGGNDNYAQGMCQQVDDAATILEAVTQHLT